MSRPVTTAALGLLALLVLIQVVPMDKSNPADQQIVPAPPEVLAVLERACFDCHSNRTKWPWYASVAPVSWLVSHDVNDGRKEVNFTDWNAIGAKKQAKIPREVWEEVDEGEMPPWYYLLMHKEARLSDADEAVLHDWSKSAKAAAAAGASTTATPAD